MKLFVDDTRKYPTGGYNCCRSAEQAKQLMKYMDFDHISLDYDLGHNKETGLDILIWMKENDIHVPVINIHSNHIIGKERMREYAEANFPDSRITMNMLMK